MRGQKKIRRGTQRIIDRQRLLFVHIHCGPSNLTFPDRFDQRRRIDQCTPGGVDQISRPAHFRKSPTIDHVLCLGRVRRVNRHKVRDFEQLAQVHPANTIR